MPIPMRYKPIIIYYYKGILKKLLYPGRVGLNGLKLRKFEFDPNLCWDFIIERISTSVLKILSQIRLIKEILIHRKSITKFNMQIGKKTNLIGTCYVFKNSHLLQYT